MAKIFSLLLVLLFAAACSVETQKARESFSDNQLPTELSKMANQELELRPLYDRISQREAADAQKLIVPIAVIDLGVDLAHPDLVDRFMFDVKDGKVVGAGHDFMGDDNFASASLINPQWYAFSAQDIKDGLIVTSAKNPFKEMLELDQEFRAQFLTKLQAHPVLSKSLFTKLSDKSFNLYGLYRIYNDLQKHRLFDPDKYTLNKASGKLLTLDFRAKVANNPVLASAWNLKSIRDLLDVPTWSMQGNSGLPTALSLQLSGIDNADVFVQFVKDNFEQFSDFARLKSDMDKLVQYRLQRNHEAAADLQSEADAASTDLSKVVEYYKRGITGVDPILSLQDAIEGNSISDAEINRSQYDYPSINVSATQVSSQVSEGLQKIDLYKQILSQIPLTPQERFVSKSVDQVIHDNVAVAQEMMKERGDEMNQLFNPDYHSRFTSLYRKYFLRNKHPLLSPISNTESHGTHVSGIIAAQNEDLRIYPVRVTTRSTMITKAEQGRMISRFKGEFQSWLAKPVVTRAIFKKIPKLVSAGVQEPQNDEQRAAFAASMMTLMNDVIDVAFEKGSMDFIFFEELRLALQHVAEKKIKVANISLGAEYNLDIPRLSEINPDKDLLKVFNFLNYEFLKFNMGSLLSTQAKDTLFVVAAGNSNSWVDGKARSALPVDLTSKFLAEQEDGREFVAPNNHLKNILGVGSLSPDEDLSQFTNILIATGTPMIFAVGEDILSPIKQTDLAPIRSMITKRLQSINDAYPVNAFDDRVVSKAKELPQFAALKEDPKAGDKIAGYLTSAPTLISSLNSLFSTQMAIEYSDHREHYSGTSMATPAVVGMIGDLIDQEAKRLNLTTDQIYDNPAMTPAELIRKITEKGTLLFPDHPELQFKKIDVRGKYERGAKAQELDKKLDALLGRHDLN